LLSELRVRQLGVVEDATLELDGGMTAITGETGAGKTMVVEAIRLLIGGRAEARVVRTGAAEAIVEGRFIKDEDEWILSRTLSLAGRNRASINDRMASLAGLTEEGTKLVDLHAQHAHQALLSAPAQRAALDAFGRVDLSGLQTAQRRVREIDDELARLGGDPQSRAREVDLLRFQLDELDSSGLDDVDEDEKLRSEEMVLADAGAHRDAADQVHEALAGDNGVEELLGNALKVLNGRQPLMEIENRLRLVLTEISELGRESAAAIDKFSDDPQRLTEINERRAVLKQLLRKYGADLAEVITYREQTRERLNELERYEDVVRQLQKQRDVARVEVERQEAHVRKARLAAAPKLAADTESRLRELALPNAHFEVKVGKLGAGNDVEFLLSPNPGQPLLPVAKAASGGELARTMLALRLSLVNSTEIERGHLTLIFDEVDAGIGGEAAVAVGRALSQLAHRSQHQVLVVTHLPQVAAFADHQITVQKQTTGAMTASKLVMLSDKEREIELARMLSGRPDSTSGRAHARELLQQAKAPSQAEPVGKLPAAHEGSQEPKRTKIKKKSASSEGEAGRTQAKGKRAAV
jgi:DNA repair protein RecN (Recombination protein N)